MVIDFVLPQVFPGCKNLAALFARVSHVLCVLRRDVLLLDGVVSNKPL
jgi:hypothetical protein